MSAEYEAAMVIIIICCCWFTIGFLYAWRRDPDRLTLKEIREAAMGLIRKKGKVRRGG